MKVYRVVNGVLPIGQGQRLFLSAAQSAARRHMLEGVGEGKEFAMCTAAQPLQFKLGELLGIDDVGKAFAALVAEAASMDGAPARAMLRAFNAETKSAA